MPTGPDRARDGEHFQEAIAHWQLGLHTELKKASSLPTAMFDASDPMLEARLAEATESLFRCLLEPELAGNEGEPALPPVELRLERVPRAELAALLAAAARGRFAPEPPPDVAESAQEEFFAVLAETCSRGYGPHQHKAAALLRQANADVLHNLDALAAVIGRRVASALPFDDRDEQALAGTCHRIAATVLRSLHSDPPEAVP